MQNVGIVNKASFKMCLYSSKLNIINHTRRLEEWKHHIISFIAGEKP